jgi:hypothetical protein
MEHKEAVRLNAAEKYLLGEMPEVQRDEYEEHYFDCAACAEELKATVAFMETGRQVAREQVLVPAAVAEPTPYRAERPGDRETRKGFFAWFAQPAFAGAAFAALLLAVVLAGYQNTVTIPGLKHELVQAHTAEVFSSFPLVSDASRGEGTALPVFRVRPNEFFGLEADMPGNSNDGYQCQIQDASGRVRLSFTVSSEEAKSAVHVRVPANSLEPGKYTFLIFKGQTSGATASAVSRLPFSIEFLD